MRPSPDWLQQFYPGPAPDGWLVTLSLLAAMSACGLVMQIAALARKASTVQQRRLAHASAAVTLGTGVWAVQLLSSLALQLQGPTLPAQDQWLFLSALPAAGAAWLGLSLLLRPGQVRGWHCLAAGAIVSVGMELSHLGAHATLGAHLDGHGHWHLLAPVCLTLGFAAGFHLRFGPRRPDAWPAGPLERAIVAGLVAGLGLTLGHYLSMTGMAPLNGQAFGTGADDPTRLTQTVLVFLLVLLLAGGVNNLLAYRQSVQLLSEKEHRFTAILDNALDGLVTFDHWGRLLSTNVRARQMLGLDAAALADRRLYEFLAPPDLVLQPLGTPLPPISDDPRDFIRPGVHDLMLLHADGERLAVRLSVGQAHLAPYDVYVGLITDISAEKQTLLRKRRLRAELQSFMRAMTEHSIYSETDRSGTITQVNAAFEAVSGYRSAELVGQDHHLLRSGLHPRAFWDGMWEHMRAGRPWRGEICNRARDGQLYWLDSTFAPVHDEDGEIRRIVCMGWDISARKANEKLLRNTQQALETSNLAARIGTWDMEVDKEQAHWSPMTCEIFDLPPHTAMTLHEMLGHVNTPAPLRRAIDRALTHGDSWDLELPIALQSGGQRWVRVIGHAEWQGQRCERLYGTVQDVDSRKRRELDLAQAREAAESASRSKDLFLATMSHELRTPMNAILGFGQMLQFDPGLDPLQQDNVAEILKAGRHLLDLINDVLDLAKINAGKLEIALQPVPLADTLRECEQLVQGMAAEHGIALQVPEQTDAVLWADALRLRQVLLNLLTNAVKYNRPGGQVRIELSAHDPGRLRLEVSDTGRGIPPERMGELFKPFNRLDTEGGTIEGTGIGLSITRRLVEMMGGTIGVRSTVDAGSTFWIDLPRASLDAQGPSAAGEAALTHTPASLPA